MFARFSSSTAQITPAQVWFALSADRRTHVIALFAQFTLHAVTARPLDEEQAKEGTRARLTSRDQHPC